MKKVYRTSAVTHIFFYKNNKITKKEKITYLCHLIRTEIAALIVKGYNNNIYRRYYTNLTLSTIYKNIPNICI